MYTDTEVTIYRARKSAMTQGLSSGKVWRIRFDRAARGKYEYDLMNWVGSKDMRSELDLTFKTKEEAIKFASKKQWQYQIEDGYEKRLISKSYADNFK